ncbi:ArsR/SmtB family transcription factor [Compostimonas suwonensis]|uniref:DNA-binding transcriptional ArsR family regulator n=1 Tax=Compostimonas suwonensis TaxID=1048394 RepID=A0A2M9BVN3_9MICO|nr:metalloregulator ArsR/SmtB family transcription factor [Compostimonas suwonensis]PJJ62018.1 DNA-binding transcriptional ArsR family regulator [Compostimonas suwonensis]
MSGKEYPVPAADDIRLTDILRALSDPGRVKMLEVLSDGEYHPCSVDAFGLNVSKSTLSHHFKTMREAGLTTVRIQGRNFDVRLRKAELDERFPGLIDALTSTNAVADLHRPKDAADTNDA